MPLDEYEEIQLSNREKDHLKRRIGNQLNQNKKNYRNIMIVAALVLAVMSPIALSRETVWASVLKVGKHIESFFHKEDNVFDGYKQVVEETVMDQNIKVTLNEIMLDDGNLLLSLNVNGEALDKEALGMDNKAFVRPGRLKIVIGDIELGDGAYHIQSQPKENQDGSWDYLYTKALKDENIHKLNVDKDYKIDLAFSSMEFEKMNKKEVETDVIGGKYSDYFGEIRGNWTFHTSVNGTNIALDTRVYSLDEKIDIKERDIEGTLIIKDMSVSPISVKINYTFEYKKGDYQSTGMDVGVDLIAENGKVISGNSNGSASDQRLKEVKAEYYVEGAISKLKITPYVYDAKNEISKAKYFRDKIIEIKLNQSK
jgi:hypothetical protein